MLLSLPDLAFLLIEDVISRCPAEQVSSHLWKQRQEGCLLRQYQVKKLAHFLTLIFDLIQRFNASYITSRRPRPNLAKLLGTKQHDLE